jgi:hypothetical protein
MPEHREILGLNGEINYSTSTLKMTQFWSQEFDGISCLSDTADVIRHKFAGIEHAVVRIVICPIEVGQTFAMDIIFCILSNGFLRLLQNIIFSPSDDMMSLDFDREVLL